MLERSSTQGKFHDGYWTAEDMARQFKKAITIHKRNHPNLIGLWAFDSSSNHNCVAKDALVVSRMNLSSGGKQAVMRDTIVDGTHYTMVFPDNYANEVLRGKPKGMKEVLKDRGLWIDGLPRTCSRCRADDKHPDRVDCCAERILELQPDFVAQDSILEEIAREEGQRIVFYPKFHCELNFIEMYWVQASAISGSSATIPSEVSSQSSLRLWTRCLLKPYEGMLGRHLDIWTLTGRDCQWRLQSDQ